jgi:hypothetical protein
VPDLKISQLPVASATTGAELFPVVQGGVTRRIALNAVRHIGSAVFDANGSMAVDTNTLFVDAVNNRVGIGTVTPASALDVVGAVRTTADGASVSLYTNTGWRHTGSGGLFIDANQGGAANTVTIRNGSGFATQLELSGSGNLGLGVTPSAWVTYKAIDLPLSGALFSRGTGDGSGLAQNAFLASGGVWTYKRSTFASFYEQVNGTHAWLTAASGTAGNAITFTQRMTLDAGGKFGLNTASPAYDMDLFAITADAMQTLRLRNGNGNASDGAQLLLGNSQNFTNAFFRLNSGANTAQAGIGSLNIGLVEARTVAFYTDNTERARIPAVGGMVVGTAALATSATGGFLYVPTCAGTPTGTPTTQTGTAPIIVDTTNHKLYFFSGGTWRDAGP